MGSIFNTPIYFIVSPVPGIVNIQLLILIHSRQNRVIKRCCLSGLRHILRRLHALQRIENCLIERACRRVNDSLSPCGDALRQHLPAAKNAADCCAHSKFFQRLIEIENCIFVFARVVVPRRILIVDRLVDKALDHALHDFFLAFIQRRRNPLADFILAGKSCLAQFARQLLHASADFHDSIYRRRKKRRQKRLVLRCALFDCLVIGIAKALNKACPVHGVFGELLHRICDCRRQSRSLRGECCRCRAARRCHCKNRVRNRRNRALNQLVCNVAALSVVCPALRCALLQNSRRVLCVLVQIGYRLKKRTCNRGISLHKLPGFPVPAAVCDSLQLHQDIFACVQRTCYAGIERASACLNRPPERAENPVIPGYRLFPLKQFVPLFGKIFFAPATNLFSRCKGSVSLVDLLSER